jgi:hypothetical protein
MKQLLLLCSSLLLAPALLSQVTPPVTPPAPPVSACPIQVNQAWLDTKGSTIPADDAHKDWFLHVKLTNKSEQSIVGFVVHAEMPVLPGRSLAKPEFTEQARRQWNGELAPAATLNRRWKITTNSNTMGLLRIWFDGIKFADGSSWTGDAASTCSFAATGHIMPAQAGH